MKEQIIHPLILSMHSSFDANYRAKFANRKVQFMSLYGQVELLYQGQITIKVNTMQATLLLSICDKRKTLSELIAFCNLEKDIVDLLLKPFFDVELVLTKQDGLLEVATNLKQIFGSVIVTSEQIIMRQKDVIETVERGAVIPYVASIHKFRVESVAIKMLKKEFKVAITVLFDTIRQTLLG
jgi:hypothetical protein